MKMIVFVSEIDTKKSLVSRTSANTTTLHHRLKEKRGLKIQLNACLICTQKNRTIRNKSESAVIDSLISFAREGFSNTGDQRAARARQSLDIKARLDLQGGA